MMLTVLYLILAKFHKETMHSLPHLLSLQSGHLQGLMQQSARLQELTEKLRSLLPEHLAKHCEVAAWEDGKVIIHSHNPAAGTVLRYQLPKVLPLLQLDARYQGVTELVCHNRPSQGIQPKEARKKDRPNYSDYAAALLKSTADNVDTPEVKAALQRLAKDIKQGPHHD
jgi:hypothetical protein